MQRFICHVQESTTWIDILMSVIDRKTLYLIYVRVRESVESLRNKHLSAAPLIKRKVSYGIFKRNLKIMNYRKTFKEKNTKQYNFFFSVFFNYFGDIAEEIRCWNNGQKRINELEKSLIFEKCIPAAFLKVQIYFTLYEL